MDTSPTASRQPKQARAIRTRERILEQAELAFAERGFEAASLTSDILDPAGISVGSFYHQFGDKRAVLHALLDERQPWRDLVPGLADAAAQDTPARAVEVGLMAMFDDIDRHGAAWAIHFRELGSADDDVRQLIRDSWGTWEASVRQIFDRWTSGGDGRVLFATFGLAGVLRRYLESDAAGRRMLRTDISADVVDACVAAFSS